MHGPAGKDIIGNGRMESGMMELAERLNPVPQSLPADRGWPAAVLVGYSDTGPMPERTHS